MFYICSEPSSHGYTDYFSFLFCDLQMESCYLSLFKCSIIHTTTLHTVHRPVRIILNYNVRTQLCSGCKIMSHVAQPVVKLSALCHAHFKVSVSCCLHDPAKNISKTNWPSKWEESLEPDVFFFSTHYSYSWNICVLFFSIYCWHWLHFLPPTFCFLYTQMVDRQINMISLSRTISHRSSFECLIFICIYMCHCALRTDTEIHKRTEEERPSFRFV